MQNNYDVTRRKFNFYELMYISVIFENKDKSEEADVSTYIYISPEKNC